MARPAPVDIHMQLDAAGRVLRRLEADYAAARARYDAEALADLEWDMAHMRAVQTTLAWLAKDREGCVQFLTTRWGTADEAA